MIRQRMVFVESSRFRDRLPSDLRKSPDYMFRNAYGTVLSETVNDNYPTLVIETLPVICGCGGSQWLCRECAMTLQSANASKSQPVSTAEESANTKTK